MTENIYSYVYDYKYAMIQWLPTLNKSCHHFNMFIFRLGTGTVCIYIISDKGSHILYVFGLNIIDDVCRRAFVYQVTDFYNSFLLHLRIKCF